MSRRVFVVLLLAAGLAGGLMWRLNRPDVPPRPAPPSPLLAFGPTDGLPAELVAGQRYTITLDVSVPDGWSDATPVTVTVSGRGAPEGLTGRTNVDVSVCTRDGVFSGGQTIRVSCPFDAPRPGPLTLYVSARWPVVRLIGPSPPDVRITRVFVHTVTAPTDE